MTATKSYCFLLAATLCVAHGLAAPAGPQLPGATLSLNQGWRFYRVDKPVPQEAFSTPAFADTRWERVNTPHAVRLEPENASGMTNFQGVSWYRRHFTAEEGWKGKKIFVEFEGAMQVADVWFNGKHLLTHYGGYLPFTVDLTDLVQYAKTDNVIALRLDNSDNSDVPPGKPQNQLDFTYLGGLYRNVWMYVTDKLHVTDAVYANKVAGGGVFVTYPRVTTASATVEVKAEVKNEYGTVKNCTVKGSLVDSGGRQVGQFSRTSSIQPGADGTFAGTFEVAKPQLWHPYHPNLYTLVTEVYDGDRLVDKRATRVGIRTIRFDKDGFWINGERLVATGVNRHQDYVYVGNALPDSGQYRDIKLLREAGALSLRCHYPFSPAMMDAADELGMMVIVANPGWQWFRPGVFVERAYQGAREMVRRDRNHPSAILWEPILNEIGYTEEFAKTVLQIVHAEYPGDQSYAASDSGRPASAQYDVLYGRGQTSGKPIWTREWGDAVDNWDDQNGPYRIRRDAGEPAMLRQIQGHLRGMERQYAMAGIGGFGLWAGIDAQRGYHHNPFYGGFLDLFRVPKFDYYLFASQRPPEVRVPGLDDGVKFSVTGEGAVIGDAAIWANPMKAQSGVATALVRSTLKPGSITVTAEARGLKPATITLQSQPLTTPMVPGAK